MASEGQTRAEERERAAREATRLVRDHFEDPEAWVRLLVTEGVDHDMVYHFDAFGPTIVEQLRVTVFRAGADLWDAVLVD